MLRGSKSPSEYGDSARSAAFLRALAEAAAATGSATTELEVYNRAIDTLHRLRVRPGLLLLGSDGLLRVYRVGVDESLTSKAWKLVGRSPETFTIAPETSPVFAQVLDEGRTIYLEEMDGLAADVLPGVPRPLVKTATRTLGFTNIIMSPVVAEDEALGILAIHQSGMERSDVHVARLFARQIGDAIGRIRLIESLRAKNNTIQEAQGRAMAAQRLEAMGRLAGGIAHDFNNLLTVIMTTGTLVQNALPPDSSQRNDLGLLLDATEKAGSLTRQLLDFARQRTGSVQVFDLQSRLSELDALLRRSVGSNIQMRVRRASPPALIRADPSQVEQIVMNLVINARDALPDGGVVDIETEVTDDKVRLVVRDDGVGMDAATVDRAFEPFFSTKARDKGTGLGLATCFGIVTAIGGTIVIDSEPGKGTAVTVQFPRAAGQARERDESPAQADAAESPGLLLIEDQDLLRAQLAKVLTRAGYRVTACESAEQGLIAFGAGEEFSLIVSDIQLPGMRGTQMAESILRRHPEIKIVLMSGHMDEELAKLPEPVRRLPILWKPFTPNELLQQLAAQLK